jgi:hypothetical protein
VTDYQRWQRRERRRRLVYAGVAWAIMLMGALCLALVMWTGLVAFCVVFG